jgi:hypothetical protein
VTLYHDDLRALPWAVELSRDAVRAVRRNLFRALAYNLAGMTLAACGVLHPVVAAILMVVSSLTLIFSSTRVGAFEASGGRKPPVGLRRVIASRTNREERNRGRKPPARLAIAHALAFALQGVAFLLLLAALREPLFAVLLVAAFALVGAVLAVAWHRRPVPHWLDMCFGMLTCGNLGMLIGWWADNGFAALHDHGCCACVEAMRDGVMKPWMWVGMLAFANVAMRWLGRNPVPRGCHALAMWTGGNAGMVVGMLAGGWGAAQFLTASVTSAVATSFAGMTAGMLAGMLAGTWCAERLFAGLRAVGLAPRWLRVTSPRTS